MKLSAIAAVVHSIHQLINGDDAIWSTPSRFFTMGSPPDVNEVIFPVD
jgi:hypothetical protein